MLLTVTKVYFIYTIWKNSCVDNLPTKGPNGCMRSVVIHLTKGIRGKAYPTGVGDVDALGSNPVASDIFLFVCISSS